MGERDTAHTYYKLQDFEVHVHDTEKLYSTAYVFMTRKVKEVKGVTGSTHAFVNAFEKHRRRKYD